MLSRSHGLHGAWQGAGRDSHGEENGPAKPCKGRSDPQTSRLEEETPTATSFPQGAHAILEQGESNDAKSNKTGPKGENARCSCLLDQLPVQLSANSELRDPQGNTSKSTTHF